MKKNVIMSFLSTCIFWGSAPAYAETSSSVEPGNSARLETIVMTLLMPEINAAVDNFYGPYLDIRPTVVAYLGDAKITNIEGAKKGVHYIIQLEIMPYIGPHISVGKERITFCIDALGDVTMKLYEHLESYPLPPNLQPSIKKPLP